MLFTCLLSRVSNYIIVILYVTSRTVAEIACRKHLPGCTQCDSDVSTPVQYYSYSSCVLSVGLSIL